jgi:hypothetical protein
VLDVQLSFAHAYTHNEQASYGGGDHLVVDRPFKAGRLERAADDALCKRRRKFSALTAVDQVWVVCKRCREIAERHGLTIPPTENEKAAANE